MEVDEFTPRPTLANKAEEFASCVRNREMKDHEAMIRILWFDFRMQLFESAMGADEEDVHAQLEYAHGVAECARALPEVHREISVSLSNMAIRIGKVNEKLNSVAA